MAPPQANTGLIHLGQLTSEAETLAASAENIAQTARRVMSRIIGREENPLAGAQPAEVGPAADAPLGHRLNVALRSIEHSRDTIEAALNKLEESCGPLPAGNLTQVAGRSR